MLSLASSVVRSPLFFPKGGRKGRHTHININMWLRGPPVKKKKLENNKQGYHHYTTSSAHGKISYSWSFISWILYLVPLNLFKPFNEFNKSLEFVIRSCHLDFSFYSGTDCGFMDIPFRFKADCVGQFTCQVVLRSWCDIRVHVLEALVTLQVHMTKCWSMIMLSK